LECAEIRRGFVAGRVPAGPEVDAHRKRCSQCRELFENGAALGRGLGRAVLPEVSADDLFGLVERDLSRETGLRARLRALPTRARVGSLIAVAAGLVAWQVFFHRRPDVGGPGASYSPAVFWGLGLALGTVFLGGAWWLLSGASAPVRSEGSRRLITLALLL